jgi:hypothetical protein
VEPTHGLRSERLRRVQGVKLDGLGVLDPDGGGGLAVVGGVHGRQGFGMTSVGGLLVMGRIVVRLMRHLLSD